MIFIECCRVCFYVEVQRVFLAVDVFGPVCSGTF